MNGDFRVLNAMEVEQVTGGMGIGIGGRTPVSGDPMIGFGDGNPFGGVGTGGRDWWFPYPIPGFGDPGPVLPILIPEPGKP